MPNVTCIKLLNTAYFISTMSKANIQAYPRARVTSIQMSYETDISRNSIAVVKMKRRKIQQEF